MTVASSFPNFILLLPFGPPHRQSMLQILYLWPEGVSRDNVCILKWIHCISQFLTPNAAHTSSTSKWLGKDLMGSNNDLHHLLCTGVSLCSSSSMHRCVCGIWRQSPYYARSCCFRILLLWMTMWRICTPELIIGSQKFSVKAICSVIWMV